MTIPLTAPFTVLAITSPGSNTLNRPMLQLQGRANEDLYSLSYDLSNSFGGVTNLEMLVLNRGFDTNASQWRLRTNTFQAFDIPLTPGTNTITVHAMDRAGNATNFSLAYTFDNSTKTNPPGVQMCWPTNTSLISGTNFTCRGILDDPTATITAQIVDGSNNTNTAAAIVERNGNFWVENLPLASGSSTLTLFATDATGNNTTVTNLTVTQSSVSMTLSVSTDISWQQKITVYGWINRSSYNVWLNGVTATNWSSDGSGGLYWTAFNVPIPSGGVAQFQAEAIPNSDNGGNGTGGGGGTPSFAGMGNPTPAASPTIVEFEEDKQPCLLFTAAHETSLLSFDPHINSGAEEYSYTEYDMDWSLDASGSTLNWSYTGHNGGGSVFDWSTETYDPNGSETSSSGTSSTEGDYSDVVSTSSGTEDLMSGEITGPYLTANDNVFQTIPSESEWWDPNPDISSAGTNCQLAYQIGYQQGGKAVPIQYVVEFTAEAQGSPDDVFGDWFDIASTSITMAGGRLGWDGIYHKVVPSGAPIFDATPNVDGGPGANNPPPAGYLAPSSGEGGAFTVFSVSSGAYKALPQATSSLTTTVFDPGNPQPAPSFCVGQYLEFSLAWSPALPDFSTGRDSWTLSGHWVNVSGVYPYNWLQMDYLLNGPQPHAWYVDGGNETVGVTVSSLGFANGQSVTLAHMSGNFMVIRPTVIMFNAAVFGQPSLTWLTPWNLAHYGSIGLGHVAGPNNMCYEVQISSPSFPGQSKIVQIIDGLNYSAFPFNESVVDARDNEDPYPDTEQNIYTNTVNPFTHVPLNILRLGDSPNNSGFSSFFLDGAFTDYIMFIPNGPQDIFVPLGNVFWGLSFKANWPSSYIKGYVDPPDGPNDSTAWPKYSGIVTNPNN